MAGLAATRGDVVFTMDADLQDPPQEMPRLLERLDQGYDVVSGYKQRRLDPWHKVYPSAYSIGSSGWWTGVHLHDHVCGLKVYRARCARSAHLRRAAPLSWRPGRRPRASRHRDPTLHRARTAA
jgi:glycosyltransferase involved in cell wall biosynthesis